MTCALPFPRESETGSPNIMPDSTQRTRPTIPPPSPSGGGEGPRQPQVDKPNTDDLLKRMRRVDPDQARRYRQRTGE